MAKKRPIGRPPKPSGQRLSDAIYVRLTPGERDAIDREARNRGVTASEIVRELIRDAGYGPKKPKE